MEIRDVTRVLSLIIESQVSRDSGETQTTTKRLIDR